MVEEICGAEADLQQSPLDRYIGFAVHEADEKKVRLRFFNEGHGWDNPNGTTCGGIFYTMAASAMKKACLIKGKRVHLSDMAVNHLRPGFADTCITAEAEVIHDGRTTMLALCDFYDDKGKYLAHGKGTFLVDPTGEGEAD